MHHPYLRPASSAARFPSLSTPPVEEDPTRLRVLVVDLDPKSRFLLTRLLQGQGFIVAAGAAGRADALKLATELRPHLLLIGASVPLKESLEVVRQCRQHHPDLGITVLADMQDFAIVGKLIECGAGAVLATPVDSAALSEELRRAGDRCIAKLATRCILAFRVPEYERHVRALPSQCDYPAGPQLATAGIAAEACAQ